MTSNVDRSGALKLNQSTNPHESNNTTTSLAGELRAVNRQITVVVNTMLTVRAMSYFYPKSWN